MTPFKPNQNEQSDFVQEIRWEGFTFLSKVKNRQAGYYPSEFPDYEDIAIEDIEIDDIFTVRAFFPVGDLDRIDGGLIDVQIESIEGNLILVNILTELPKSFPLQKDTSIELTIDELLYFAGNEES